MASLTCLRKCGVSLNTIIFFLVGIFSPTQSNFPEQGIFHLEFGANVEYNYARRTMYGDTKIELHIACLGKMAAEKVIQMGWLIRGTGCFEEYNQMNKSIVPLYYNSPRAQIFSGLNYNVSTQLVCTGPHNYNCSNHLFDNCRADFHEVLIDHPKPKVMSSKGTTPVKSQEKTPAQTTVKPKMSTTKPPPAPQKRAAADDPPKQPAVLTSVSTPVSTPVSTAGSSESDAAAFSRKLGSMDGGVYLIIVRVFTHQKTNVTVSVKVYNDKYGYISPIDYPLFVVYGVLCAVYIIYAILWLILLALNWKDILRLQYWIAGVIALGLIEKAVFVSEYDSVYRTGVSVTGAVIFGSVISCLKRALARMLIIIASVGFGIVKPRLGPMLNKVLGVGALYLALAGVEAWYNTKLERVDTSAGSMYLQIVLIVLDAVICWWIFSNLITTLRTLRLRRNIVKHSVYRHFTHTLIIAILASVGFIIWSAMAHKRKACVEDYSTYWLDEAFWPILFTAILLVIIILWRPTTNNQRYAFSPLLDHGDEDEEDDEEEIVMNDAYEGMKLRGVKEKAPRKDPQTKAEEDLKWVEDNIPASIADKAIVLDSDDDIKQTRFEMGKME